MSVSKFPPEIYSPNVNFSYPNYFLSTVEILSYLPFIFPLFAQFYQVAYSKNMKKHTKWVNYKIKSVEMRNYCKEKIIIFDFHTDDQKNHLRSKTTIKIITKSTS